MTNRLLLDTCAVIWLAEEARMSAAATNAIDGAFTAGQAIAVSSITAWELGLLNRRGRLPLAQNAAKLFGDFVRVRGIEELTLDASVLIDSSFLPGEFHNDPADRIIIATARARDLIVVTRDRAILAYAASGYVRALPC